MRFIFKDLRDGLTIDEVELSDCNTVEQALNSRYGNAPDWVVCEVVRADREDDELRFGPAETEDEETERFMRAATDEEVAALGLPLEAREATDEETEALAAAVPVSPADTAQSEDSAVVAAQ